MVDPTRRGLLEAVVVVGGGAFALALGLPGAAYLLTPVLREGAATWVDLGALEDLRAIDAPLAVRFEFETQAGYARDTRPGLLYVVPDAHADDGVRVLSAICTHKGCNVAWAPEEALFACPCHRGRFDASGERVSGPPRLPLERVGTRLTDGHLWAEVGEAQA